jgi:trans-aconitate methyltransferase
VKYVHGYTAEESVRLVKQAKPLGDLFHDDLGFSPGQKVLEVGCGVGGQTVLLAKKWPDTEFVSIDKEVAFIRQASEHLEKAHVENVGLQHADIMSLPFDKESFDHIYVCFVLEHLACPVDALFNLNDVLKTGGTITVVEGDHDSFFCHPNNNDARKVVDCLTKLQAMCGGNALIGRELYPLLTATDFCKVSVKPKSMYVDSSRPDLVENFSKSTLIGVLEEIKDQALACNLIDSDQWRKGIDALYRSTEVDGTLCYTFFKAQAMK